MSALDCQALRMCGEYLASGYFEVPDASNLRRLARGLRRHFELAPLPEWHGDLLYPTGSADLPAMQSAIRFSYWSSLVVDTPTLEAKLRQLHDQSLNQAHETLYAAGQALQGFYRVGSSIPAEYGLGGAGYTHSIINYGRILREGLGGYTTRLEHYDQSCHDATKADFYAAMRDVLAGLTALCKRIQALVETAMAQTPYFRKNGTRLLKALRQAPQQPVRSFYEAIVATNLLWYIDGCDNLGRFDQDLWPYLEQALTFSSGGSVPDKTANESVRTEALELVRMLWRNIDANSGWNVAIGGSNGNGGPAYNELTAICLEAAVGRRRPNLALRVRRDMPDTIFDRTLDTIASGCGLPALYNDEGYTYHLPGIYGDMGEDRYHVAFGGCTETMVHGCSNVGSIDGGVNLLVVLDKTIKAHLVAANSFDDFITAFLADVRMTIAAIVACVNTDQRLKAACQPQPLRTLFVDDCLERGVEFNAGGARYNSGVINVGGIANVADALAVLRELVFTNKVNAERMLAALQVNYHGYEDVLQAVRGCPRFGNDDERVDSLAVTVARETFSAVRSHRTWRGDTPFEPACIMFVTYAGAGEIVGATPDGRHAAEPVADSIGPMQGRDMHGPTALLRSVCKLPLQQAIGTPVLNIRLGREILSTSEGREKVKALIRAYFAMGGMQIQATVIDQEVLRDAIAHPERHADLIVRIGGYSEYFNNLSSALKLSILERTEHC
ncbi:MAG: hypothetical protein M1546_03055 [Chloroflexi bacterium]|nr:hypothetical protein [Chloroflexota bacterium]